MSSDTKAAPKDRFSQRLDELRSKIESLPEEQRSFFQSQFDVAERQHNEMQENCARIRDWVDNLSNKPSAKFDTKPSGHGTRQAARPDDSA